MVVTQLMGGLGNQLFQYAAGRAIAEANRARLKLDLSALSDDPIRSYALKPFAISADILTESERARLGLNMQRDERILKRLIGRLRRQRSIRIVAEASFSYDPRVLQARSPCYLTGYWQSPKYFRAIEHKIREELAPRWPLSAENADLARRLQRPNSVSVHVRRGDYATNPHTNKYHGTCGPDYYYAAERLLQGLLGALELYVFSDDSDWARGNLRFASPATVVSHHPPARAHVDLQLMTLCRHHIIANSTFSWWGAWLCDFPGKRVVAPRNWFRAAQHSTEDLIPKDWIRS